MGAETLERFKWYRVEDIKSGEQFDACYIYRNTGGGHMLSERGGSRVVRVTDDGEPHPNCAWGPHKVLGKVTLKIAGSSAT